ncbi:hypothetical protein NL108_016227 [Boleophthalmus pectinirostris]|nr:hypothetical protein NL108_016227 [Boleophthalmus pectinirostris]
MFFVCFFACFVWGFFSCFSYHRIFKAKPLTPRFVFPKVSLLDFLLGGFTFSPRTNAAREKGNGVNPFASGADGLNPGHMRLKAPERTTTTTRTRGRRKRGIGGGERKVRRTEEGGKEGGSDDEE